MRRDASRHSMSPREPLEAAILADDFKAEVRYWAGRMELGPREIHLVGMKHKWASCSPQGRVTFDIELLRQPAEFRRAVIIHELLHLRIRNHGRLFSALLRTHLAAATSRANSEQ